MRAGKLDQIITIERRTYTVSNSGQRTANWNPIANGTCWASVESRGGAEAHEGNAVKARHAWLVKIRHRDDVKAEDRILHRGRYLYIGSVSANSPRDREVELICTETAP
jgi:SPP1 family predicted phage head-tail adaptor